MKRLIFSVVLFVCPAFAEDISDFGVTNPEEMTWGSNIARVERGEVDMNICASGYMMTKSGDHAAARRIFEACAAAGYTGAMTWMSQLDNNGLGAEYDPDASADWDKRAAAAGDRVGKFNHGLNLLRGHGIARDEALGRRYVDEAAKEGLPAAKRLRRADYDVDEVTPDADNWKYAPLF